MSDGLDELRRLLAEPPGHHLDDATLAEVAAAEAAGEDVDALYALELQHIESCLPCAEGYSSLVTIMLEAEREMAIAAGTLTPQDVFTSLLLRDLKRLGHASAELAATVRTVVAELPVRFIRLPATAAEVDAADPLADLFPALHQALRRHAATLGTYLQTVANTAWGRPVDVQATTTATGHRLQLQPGLAPSIPILESEVGGEEWLLLAHPVGSVTPLFVEARVRRQSELAGTLQVRVDRPSTASPAGRVVQVQIAGQTVTAVTDDLGIAQFSDIPIAVLPELEIFIGGTVSRSG
jgi:hypothetical protein